jgi:hypothetical protein
MKIILSPTKTQIEHDHHNFKDQSLLFPKKHKKVLSVLKKLSKSELSKAMKISGDLLEETYKNIKSYKDLKESQAFDFFTGLVFFNLDRENYQEEEYDYIDRHVVILDALHGVLLPGTMVKKYRLDMKMKIGLDLYKHWQISDYFKDDLVINLASDEFSKMLSSDNMITISFLEYKKGTYKNLATYSKMARGKFLDYMIKNKITEIENLKLFNKESYSFNEELSTNINYVFTR